MAYINFQNGFKIQTASAIDKRILLTKADMKTAEDVYMLPDQYFCICSEDGKLYLFDVNNAVDSATGKYRLVDEQVFNNSRFTTLETKVGDAESGLVKDVTKVKADVTAIQGDVSTLQTEVTTLKEEVEDPDSGLAKRIQELSDKMDTLEPRVQQAEQDLAELEQRFQNLKISDLSGTLDGGNVTL